MPPSPAAVLLLSLGIHIGECYPCAAMMRLRLTRFRAFLLLLVLGASLTGQIMAGAVMAAPMDMRAATHVSAASSCPACNDGSSDGMPSQCVAVTCWNLTAIPASDPLMPPVGPMGFVAATYMAIPGLSPGPDPHPPRVLFSVSSRSSASRGRFFH